MDKESIIKNAQSYAKSVKQLINPVQVILYGSYAKGTATQDSDIDIAIIVDRLDADYLDTAKLLFKLRRGIDDRIEPVLINRSNDRSGFSEDIIQKGYSL